MRFLLALWIVLLCPIFTFAESSWNAPPAHIRPEAAIEEGFNFAAMAGFSAGNGRRLEGFSPNEYDQGWVSKHPQVQLDFEYGFNSFFAARLRVPMAFLLADMDFYFSPIRFFGAGASLGINPSVYVIGTLPLGPGYLSLSPSVTFPSWGATQEAFDNKDYSRVVYNVQLSGGLNLAKLDVGLSLAYAHAPGAGTGVFIEIFDETGIRHSVTTMAFVSF